MEQNQYQTQRMFRQNHFFVHIEDPKIAAFEEDDFVNVTPPNRPQNLKLYYSQGDKLF